MSEKIIHDKVMDDKFILDSSKNLFFMGSFVIDLERDHIKFTDNFIKHFKLSEEDSDTDAKRLITEFLEFENGLTYIQVIEKIVQNSEEISFEAKVNRRDGSLVWILINGIYNDRSKMIYGRIIDVTTYKETLELAKGSITFLESLFELVPYPIYYQDDKGEIIRANNRFCEFLGISEGDLLDKKMNQLIVLDKGETQKGLNYDELMVRGSQVVEKHLKYKDGTVHNVIFNRALMTNNSGDVDGILGVIIDITEKTKLEEKLKTHNRVKDILMNISNKVMDYEDENELFQEALEQYIKISKTTDFGSVLKLVGDTFVPVASVGYVSEAIDTFRLPVEESFIYKHAGGSIVRPGIIQNLHEIWTARDIDFVPLVEKGDIQSILYIPLFSEGVLQWVISFDSSTKFYYDEEDLLTAEIIKGQIELIIKMFNIYHQAKIFSRYDSLTNLMNRRYFEAVFEDRVKLAKRNEEGLVLVHFDLDDLKGVNDQFGHMVGDAYIISFTELLTSHFREADTFGRIGGDEFVGIFYNSDFDTLHEKMILLRTLFQSTGVRVDKISEVCGAFSFGLSVYPQDGDNIDELLKIADERMYLFKHKNKRRVQLFNI